MATCPVCQAPVQDDFGLIECNNCQAQLMVHVDGRVEYQGAESVELTEDERANASRVTNAGGFVEGEREFDFDGPDVRPPPPPPPSASEHYGANEATRLVNAEESPDLVPPQNPFEEFQLPEQSVAQRSARVAFPPARPDAGDEPEDGEAMDLVEPIDDDDLVERSASESAAVAKLDEEDMDFTFDSGDPEPPAQVYASASAPNSPDLSDVAAFGNSDLSGGRDGNLRYNLIIEGIDTTDVRSALREALTDRKFMWDIDQILRSIRGGKVNIPNVAPTKAYILISRLRGMPVRVRWEQYAIQQT